VRKDPPFLTQGLASVGGSPKCEAEHGFPGRNEEIATPGIGQDRTHGLRSDKTGEVQNDWTDFDPQAWVVGHRKPRLNDSFESRVSHGPPGEVDEAGQIRGLGAIDMDHLCVEPTQCIGQELGKAAVVMMERAAGDPYSVTDFDGRDRRPTLVDEQLHRCIR
jgi:hypothetical protein